MKNIPEIGENSCKSILEVIMTVCKRIFLFLVLNILIFFSLSAFITMAEMAGLFRIHPSTVWNFFLITLIYGMGGAFLSLAFSRVFAKWVMGVKLVTSYDCSSEGVFLRRSIERIAKKACLSKIPQIGVFQSPTPNAFATGPTASRSLVAVSSGLLQNFDEAEIEAIIGHEIAHIQNGDMVTMTLLQGIVNSFVFFLSYIFADLMSRTRRGNSAALYYISRFLFRIVFMLLGSMLVASFSRRREFRADRQGALLTTKDQMIRALERLKALSHIETRQETPKSVAALMCHSPSRFWRLFSSHPPLDERIQALHTLP